MTAIPSFNTRSRVAVIGASGGIGAALLNILEADERVSEIFAFSRTPDRIHAGRASRKTIDLTDEKSIASAAEFAAGELPLDLVLVATGLLHRGEAIRPEKSMRELDPTVIAEAFAINATGPAIVAKHFLPRLRRGSKTLFAALSARVGSIGDNRLGGWLSYRASKAALNQLLRTLAIEHARRFPESVVAALHPGTVDTRLSRPFTRRVSDAQLFEPQRSAAHLVDVIDGLTPDDSGGFFAWDGSAVEF